MILYHDIPYRESVDVVHHIHQGIRNFLHLMVVLYEQDDRTAFLPRHLVQERRLEIVVYAGHHHIEEVFMIRDFEEPLILLYPFRYFTVHLHYHYIPS